MTGHTILITGATSGIGRFTALRLAREGHRVFATGRRASALESLKAEAANSRLETLELDVTCAESIRAACAEIDRRTDGYGIDALINSAGYGTVGPVEEMTPDDLRAQFETNVFGLIAVTQAFLPKMRARGAGRIVNVSSIGGRMTFPLFGAYNATKHAIESMSDALRIELAPFGVKVVLVEPGAIDTGFADRSVHEATKYRRKGSPYAFVLDRVDELRALSDRSAVGPDSVAKAIAKAISRKRPRARYVAPFRYWIFLKVVRILPTALVDWALGRLVGFTRARLAAAGKGAAAQPGA
jgi:NAD(P)-dependent dehydrogenase (short-subunit alcohol dehydrogenase family)